LGGKETWHWGAGPLPMIHPVPAPKNGQLAAFKAAAADTAAFGSMDGNMALILNLKVR